MADLCCTYGRYADLVDSLSNALSNMHIFSFLFCQVIIGMPFVIKAMYRCSCNESGQACPWTISSSAIMVSVTIADSKQV